MENADEWCRAEPPCDAVETRVKDEKLPWSNGLASDGE